ncbi:MAG: hypothetical protein DHS20C15_28380 [Planctomycetota bacterium]|nr:MAG: hypothetical protein DHS20C15_28380 [Planctomycetota bacterium]
MLRKMLSVSAGFGLLALLSSPVQAQDVQPMRVYEGKLVVSFHVAALEQAGLQLVNVEQTDDLESYPDLVVDGEPMLFRVDGERTDLTVLQNREGNFQPYGVLGGEINTFGGFTLQDIASGASVDFNQFVVAPREVRNDGPGGQFDPDYFYMMTADDDVGDFQMCYVKVLFAEDGGYGPSPGGPTGHSNVRLRIKAFDLVVTENLAAKLGRPDLTDRHLGGGQIDADFEPFGGRWEHPEGQNMFTPYNGVGAPDSSFQGGFKDVSLGILNSITQLGHTGTFPNGRAGLSMATTSCNLGTVNVPWLQANNVLQEDHPGIGMNLFREADYTVSGQSISRFEQVGVSWVKHGFFALSNSQCIPCQNPSNGTFLGVGCSDTYGTGNNGDRYWLGPRSEWNPHLGTWDADNSFFDGTPAGDGFRNENGSGNGSVDHRLEAFDSDLGDTSANYYYEAIYLVRGDEDISNNIGSRECFMNWNGFSWQFTTPSSGNPLIEGPALSKHWGDTRVTQALQDDPNAVPGDPSDDGNVVLAVDVTDLGNGTWRYEYALYNWTLDRGVDSFSVPAFGPVSDFYFHDTDQEAANDWVPVVNGKNITWTFPGVNLPGHKVAGPLEWGTVYNFGFTSIYPPATHDAALGIHEAGNGGDLLAVETRAPTGLSISADVIAPETGGSVELIVRGGNHGAMIGALSVNGILVNPLILTAMPVPFVGGEATLSLAVPPAVSGLDIGFIAADFDTSVVQLSNLMTLAIQ